MRDARVRDAVRERDAARINEAVLTLVAEGSERMTSLRKLDESSDTARELDAAIEVVDWGVRTFGSYVGASNSQFFHPFYQFCFKDGSISISQ